MAEELHIPDTEDREKIYESLTPQIKALTEDEPDLIANMANIAAALKEALGFFWVGFYLVNEDELVLGPFQGPIACTRIQKGKGVCGTVWEKAETLVVPNVDEFPGHIACSAASKSEIVVPIIKNGEVFGVIDMDSNRLDDFGDVDRAYLEKLVGLL